MNSNKERFKRIVILLSLCAVVSLIHLTVFRSTHYLHLCAGEECVICHQLQQADGIAKILSLAAGAVLPGGLMAAVVLIIPGRERYVIKRTLVADKIRIDC